MKKLPLKCLFLLILLSSIKLVNAQVCTGNLGDPIINIDFGRGPNNIGSPISQTNYRFILGSPDDGEYTITKTTNNLNGGWHQNVVNHTPNDPNGYFMLVNADDSPGVFYEREITSLLCANTTYEFSAWAINILRNPGRKPNIKFTIENNGSVVKEFTTGDIQEGSPTNWIKYGTLFTTPNNIGTITLRMTNVNPGGVGNDLGLDDITFRPCGPNITTSVPDANNFINNIANICIGDTKTLTLNAQVAPGTYASPQYQWQKFDGTNWMNSTEPGSQTPNLTVTFTNATLGDDQYRVLVAENGNINSPNCRVVSTTITVRVNPKPTPTATNSGPACFGSNVQLNVDQGVSFAWTGPNGFLSTVKNPIIPNVSGINEGVYEVTVTSAAGCTNTTSTTVTVLPEIAATVNTNEVEICENQSFTLAATGGSTYTWLPIDGLSDPNIANPVASPKETTTYTVTISNGPCHTEREVKIIVLKDVSANAGEDKKILTGQSIQLNGHIEGDNAIYSWWPTDYLDDPTKLNPVATPPTDITYTLTAQSDCNVTSDDVFIKVYPKIEIPNTFTPNGDGINDTWNIPSISAFENPKLQVVNRNGQLVYETKNKQPWDGKLNGKNLPEGVYYYNLYLNDEFKLYSGWIMLAR